MFHSEISKMRDLSTSYGQDFEKENDSQKRDVPGMCHLFNNHWNASPLSIINNSLNFSTNVEYSSNNVFQFYTSSSIHVGIVEATKKMICKAAYQKNVIKNVILLYQWRILKCF